MSKKRYKFNVIGKVFDHGVQIARIDISTKGEEVDWKKVVVSNGVEDRKIISIEVGEDKVSLNLEVGLHVAAARGLKWNDDDFTNEEKDWNYSLDLKGNPDISFIKDEYIIEEFEKFNLNEDFDMKYADFKPEEDGEKHPLIIWLHGAGEGGRSCKTQILGNRGGIAFVTRESQQIFDKAYVIAPQCPTFWLDSFKIVDKHGRERILPREKDYTFDLLNLVEKYIEENSNIDRDRIYVSGCSMGGYQGLKLLAAKPTLFAASFLSCPARVVSKEELERIKGIPMWLVHAKKDTTVPVSNSREIYNYLKSQNCEVEYTEYDNIYCEGEVFDPHASYFNMLNNEPKNARGTHIFEWVASKNLLRLKKMNK